MSLNVDLNNQNGDVTNPNCDLKSPNVDLTSPNVEGHGNLRGARRKVTKGLENQNKSNL